LDDQTLIAGVLAGDASAAQMLYDRYVTPVYRLAYRIAGDDGLAQDWVVETFVRAFSRLAQFRGETPFVAWLLAVGRSVSLNGLRKVNQSRKWETDLDEATTSVGSDPARIADVRMRVHEAIDDLPEKYRRVLVMYDVEGYSHDEIGTALGIAPQTVKVQLFRARAKLRTQLADLVSGE
jgi:RNA polymerase sigma-70 factor (ECF subfamily)